MRICIRGESNRPSFPPSEGRNYGGCERDQLAEMTTSFPFLTSYDPPGTSEGTLDPLGLYQIADQLAVQLVPAVRERMLRIRFLTAMAVGVVVTEGFDDDPEQP